MIEISSKPEQFVSGVSYADPATRKERLLLAGLEQNQMLPPDEDEEDGDEHEEEESHEDGGEEL